MKKEPIVNVSVDLGALKPVVKRAARARGVTVNEFIVNALESHVRRDREHVHPENFVRHGGKHLFGKHTGYEVTPDGKYYPAPAWTQQFEQLFAERSAITNLAHVIIAQSQQRLIEIEKRIFEAKHDLVDDLGLDPEKNWNYYGGTQKYVIEAEKSVEQADND